MKFDLKALAMTSGILWAAAVFLTGAANLIWPGYGAKLLEIVASIYPGYKASGAFGDLLVGTGYSLVDGAVCALVFGWIYNLFIGKAKPA